MRRARLTPRQERVLSVLREASADGTTWVSGYDVFERLRTGSRFGGVNHGRVFSALRSLRKRELVRVRLESAPGMPGKRAAYALAADETASR